MAADRPFDTTTPSSSQLTGPTAASGASPVAAGEKVASPLSTSSTSSTGVQTSRSEQSQAAQIWREFKKRKLAVCAAILMIVEIMIAVFAPFIANDRPMAFRGVNRFEFQQLIQTVESLMAMANGESRQESGAAKRSIQFWKRPGHCWKQPLQRSMSPHPTAANLTSNLRV